MGGLFVCALKTFSGTISKISGTKCNFSGTIIETVDGAQISNYKTIEHAAMVKNVE